MKYLKRFNENLKNSPILDEFYKEYKDLFKVSDEEENEYSNIELLDLIGDLTINYNLEKSDVEYVLNYFNTSFDINKLLKITLDEWDEKEKRWDDIYKEFKSTDKEESITNFLKFLDAKYHVPESK